MDNSRTSTTSQKNEHDDYMAMFIQTHFNHKLRNSSQHPKGEQIERHRYPYSIRLTYPQDTVFSSVTQMDNSRTSTTSRKKPNMMMMAMASHGQTIPESSIAAVQCALLKRLNSTHKKIVKSKQGKKNGLKIYRQVRYTPPILQWHSRVSKADFSNIVATYFIV